MRHRQAIDEAGLLSGIGDCEHTFRQTAVVGGKRHTKFAACLKAWTCLAKCDRAAHVNGAQFFGVALMLAAQNGKVFIHPDKGTPGIMFTLVFAADDDEHFLVLAAHRIKDFIEVVRAALPVRPDGGNGAGVFIGKLEPFRQKGRDGVGIGAVFKGDQLTGIVPRHRGQDRRFAGLCPGIVKISHMHSLVFGTETSVVTIPEVREAG